MQICAKTAATLNTAGFICLQGLMADVSFSLMIFTMYLQYIYQEKLLPLSMLPNNGTKSNLAVGIPMIRYEYFFFIQPLKHPRDHITVCLAL